MIWRRASIPLTSGWRRTHRTPGTCGGVWSSRYRPRREGWIPCAGTSSEAFQCIGEPEEVRRLEEQLKTESLTYTIAPAPRIFCWRLWRLASVRLPQSAGPGQLPVEASAAFGDNYNDDTGGRLAAASDGKQMQALLARFPLHAPDNEHDGVYHGIVRLGLVQEEDQPGQAE